LGLSKRTLPPAIELWAITYLFGMPSIIASHFCSEPVNLVSSDTSPYDPPHRTSQEKTSRQSSSTTATVLNGFAVDGSGASKKIDGVVFRGPKDASSSLQSLPNGRLSDSTEGRGKTHSRNGSDISIANGVNGGMESGRRSPASTYMISKPSATEETVAPPQTNGVPKQPSRPRSPEKCQPRSGTGGLARGHSSSAPQSHTSNPIHTEVSAQPSKSNAFSPATPLTDNRNSAPVHTPRSDSNAAGASTSSLHPIAPRLVHRHTLQVPRHATGRTSRDFSSPVKTSSDSADADTERFSPTHGTRGSGSLGGRPPTRSIHSDVMLDEIPQNDDMARWTETIRQKRASRKQKKEAEEEDDRVIVGTKVDMHHVNWVTAYNMLTGIRFTVSRTNAKIDRELTDADFDARHKFSFDM